MYNSYKLKNKSFIHYYPLLVERTRNLFYYDALQSVAKDRVVLDLGTGTGILTHYALTAGAEFVFAVEENPNIAILANQILKNSFPELNFKVLIDNFWKESLYKKFNRDIDVLVSETIGHALFNEGMIKTWATLRKYYSKPLISIPDRLAVDLHFYENINDIMFVQEPDNLSINLSTEVNITIDDVVDMKFYNSLMKVDSKLFSNLMPKGTYQVKWATAKNIPTSITQDILSYSYDNLPELNSKLDGIIETEIKIDKPGIILLHNKFEFNNRVYNLTDSKKQPWRFNPCFIVTIPGKYKLKYNESYKENLKTTWLLEFIS